jgi:hypothetical protein
MRQRSALLWLLAIFQLWLAHAIGYMIHEYAHSFTAWLLHYKTNPLALDYGGLNLNNLLFLDDIDENVNYAPIFRAGHGPLASIIAGAGVLIGNGISYFVSRFFYSKAKQKNMRACAMFFFLLCVMSVGNFLSYVPIRTFATHADMATTAQGLAISPWLIALVLGIPFALAIWHLFTRILPDAVTFLFPTEPALQAILVLLTTYLVFAFFGDAGIHNYGNVSHWLSIISVYVLFPVVTIACWQRFTTPPTQPSNSPGSADAPESPHPADYQYPQSKRTRPQPPAAAP